MWRFLQRQTDQQDRWNPAFLDLSQTKVNCPEHECQNQGANLENAVLYDNTISENHVKAGSKNDTDHTRLQSAKDCLYIGILQNRFQKSCHQENNDKISSCEIHCFFSTQVFSISVIIAYPPPKVNRPVFAKLKKRSRRRFNSLPPDIHTDRLKNPDNIQHAKSSRTTLRRR